MRRYDVVVVGGGQAGLAASACLTSAHIEHLVLERGHVANSWRTERWDSLTLLSPNWHSRLPGHCYSGDNPHGYMSAAQTAGFLEGYAEKIEAPIETMTNVRRLTKNGDRYCLDTDRGLIGARVVVIASGACGRPVIPAIASDIPKDLLQLTPLNYRNAEQLPAGAALVVGASASGAQIALELLEAGRQVFVAAGRHVRAPRRWREKDIIHWLDKAGLFDQRHTDVPNALAAQTAPSFQLIGRQDGKDLDLNRLQRAGAVLTGRVKGVRGRTFVFHYDLEESVKAADAQLANLLRTLSVHDASSEEDPLKGFVRTETAPAPTSLGIDDHRIASVIWATGFRPDLSWIDLPIGQPNGHLRHREGVCAYDGLYTLGQPFQRKRKSNFIDGVGEDAAIVADHICAYLRAHADR